MSELIQLVASTSIPTIFIIFGLLLIFIGIGGQFTAHVITNKIKPQYAFLLGFSLLISGISIYLMPKIDNANSIINSPDSPDGDGKNEISSRVIFTSAFDKNKNPIDSVTELPLSNNKIYIHSNWFHLTPGKEYSYESEIYDGKENLVHNGKYKFIPEGGTYTVRTTYVFKKNIDTIGSWKVKLSLNNQNMVSKEINITKN